MKTRIGNKTRVTLENVLNSKSAYIWANNGITYDIKIEDMSILLSGIDYKLKYYKTVKTFKNAITRILKMQKMTGLNSLTK